jgi:FMN phosphatase YigB (HAD superfamily)/DNA-binding XRE family transcriptional regulator
MTMVDEKGLGKRLQAARQKAGLTQQDLCHQAGLSYSTLAKIERGAIKSPSIFTIAGIADVLHSSLDELVGFDFTAVKAAPKRQAKSGVRFVYFDVNGCLVRFFHRAFTKLAQDTGASPDHIEMTFWHYNDIVCRGEMTLPEFNERFATQLGVPTMDWQKYYMDAIDPIPEMAELLQWAVGYYHVGLLTNIMPGFVQHMVQNGLLPDITYSAIIDSSQVHAIKPEAEIYEAAETKAGCRPSEILLVDDSRSNLMAAEKRGWHVLWFDDYLPGESATRVRAALEPAD